jgi:hypothetical protein
MVSSDKLRAGLEAVMAGTDGPLASADRLCHACVDLLGVDGAAISFVHDGENRGTFGSSGKTSRRWDEYQFTFGEGPCLDAVRDGHPVLAEDLEAPGEQRWPAFARAMLGDGVRGVFAFPVRVATTRVGALDLFRRQARPFDDEVLVGAEWASHLAALPLLALMTAQVDWASIGDGGVWSQLESLERIEVYQATGMVQVQLDVDAAEALIRLRGYAFSHGMTVSEVAWAVVERRLVMEADDFGLHEPEAGAP